MKAVFLRLLEARDKENALLIAIGKPRGALGRQRFEVDPAAFGSVSRSPFAYWVSDRVRNLFVGLARLQSATSEVWSTNPLNDDFRYARSWWEVSAHRRPEWISWAKGGSYSPYYYDIDTVIHWSPARRTYAAFLGTENRPLERPASLQHFFRPGLTWPRRTQGGLSLRAMSAGCIFADKGPAAFVANDRSEGLLALLAITNGQAFRALVDLQMAFGSYEVGVIQQTPVPNLAPADELALAALARRAWSQKRFLDTHTETSHAFTLPALLHVHDGTLASRAVAWVARVQAVEMELATIQAEIDARCFDLYGIGEDDRRAITEGFGAPTADPTPVPDADLAPDDKADDEDAETALADATSLTAELVSWAAGVAFGRFDVRLATEERSAPPEPDPFDPLPVCSPGMLTGDDGLPLAAPPPGYPLAFPADGVLVDEPGHRRDLTAAVRAVFDVVFGAVADARWREAAALLDPKGHDLRAWLSGSFFEHHLKRYSKSRRKAPILWQLATASGSYALWLYAHRLTSDTFFHLQNEFVGPKLAHEERKLTALVQDGGPNPTAASRKAIDRQETFVGELRAFREEVARVAPLWKPDLNDGVLLTAAPLWRLVPQHRAWQKELRSAWESLASGKYDWAHLAMHLWPERVVPKCATDRSLAIAHGLEDVFWVEGSDGKWKARSKPTRPVAEVVVERGSAAVKAALKSLLEASPSGAQGPRRSTRSRGAR